METLLFSVHPLSPLLYGSVLKNYQYKLLQNYSVLPVKQFTFLHMDAFLSPSSYSESIISNSEITSLLLIQMAAGEACSI